jgi:LacI family transcriptional regulator, gluconate utilization system Gnt-I transcriptional repressor
MTRDISRRSRLEDVAARAGVSPITVSRVIRTPDMVALETRLRVEAVIQAIDYIPNAIARSLASNQTKLVVAVFPNLQNALLPDTIAGLSEVLNSRGLSLVIGSVGRSPDAEENLIASLMAHRPCAVFLHRKTHTDRTRRMLLAAKIPVVEGGDLVSDPIDSIVSYSHEAAACALTAHLLKKGRRKLAFVGSKYSDRLTAHFAGYCSALRDAGLPTDRQQVIHVPHSYEGGQHVIRSLLERQDNPDCVIFASATTAAGALLECARAGIAVPQRVSIASLDDSELAPCLSPPLTAIQISRQELGRKAAQIIIDCLGGRPGQIRVELNFTICHRGSD